MKKSNSRKSSSKKQQIEHFNVTLDRFYLGVIIILLIILTILYFLCKKCINKNVIDTQ
jgi:hypothetical protein